ncbi:MAG TPA: sugar ABC transporter permease [Chloroflexota bacterium]|nr:sugar ABC transporter permease [Chloroflexota bacterium]
MSVLTERGNAASATLERPIAGRRSSYRLYGNPLWGYLFVGPPLIVFAIFNVWPILRGIVMAFQDYRWLVPRTQCVWCTNGLANYAELLQDDTFWHSLRVSAAYTLMYTPTTILLALLVAVLIGQVRSSRLEGIYRVICYLPVVLPVTAAVLVWKSIYDTQFGYLNQFLTAVLGIQSPPNWLGSPEWALVAAVIPAIWRNFGYDMLLFLVGLYGIGSELYEAASIDGAGAFERLRFITLPLLKPTFVLVLVLSAGVVSATEEMLLMFGSVGGPGESALTAGLYAYRTAFLVGDMRLGYAASINLVLGLIQMAMAGAVFLFFRTERA